MRLFQADRLFLFLKIDFFRDDYLSGIEESTIDLVIFGVHSSFVSWVRLTFRKSTEF